MADRRDDTRQRRGRDDEPPGGVRRQVRRTPGALEIGPLSARRPGAAGTGRGGISEARAYTPRGRTVRETGLDHEPDPHRPALRLIDGGPADPSPSRRSEDAPPISTRDVSGPARTRGAPPQRVGGADRTEASRPNTSRSNT